MIRFDVTVRRPCVVGVRVLQRKSRRFTGWRRQITRWQKVVSLEPGKTSVTGVLHPNELSPMRVTDERDGKEGKHVYSYYHTFNKDSTRFQSELKRDHIGNMLDWRVRRGNSGITKQTTEPTQLVLPSGGNPKASY